ncbi:MAG: DUF4834 family protein [Flavobacteriales bacterium]
MVGLLKTILIFAFIYYGIKFLSPFVKRYAMRKVGEKLEKQMKSQFGGFDGDEAFSGHSKDKRSEGDVRVEKSKHSNQKNNPASKSNQYNTDKMGEYIDFEEIKE